MVRCDPTAPWLSIEGGVQGVLVNDTLLVNGAIAPEPSLPYLYLSGGTTGLELNTKFAAVTGLGDAGGFCELAVINQAPTGVARLFLGTQNNAPAGGKCELVALANGGAQLNALNQFISMNTTSGLANLAIEPNSGGTNNGESQFATMAPPTKRGRAEAAPKGKRACRAAKSLEDVLPGGPAMLATWLSPWTTPTDRGGDETFHEAGRMYDAGVCDHAGFHMARDLLQLACANRTWNQLRFPARNANSFADQCHQDFCFRCSLEQEDYLKDASLELLPRREKRLVVLAQAIGSESAAAGLRVMHMNTSGAELANRPRDPLPLDYQNFLRPGGIAPHTAKHDLESQFATMVLPTKRRRAEAAPKKRKRARRAAKSLEDVLPGGPQSLALRAPYQNANSFVDLCHGRVICDALYFARTSFERHMGESECYTPAATTALLQRREGRVMAVANAALSCFSDRDLARRGQHEIEMLCYESRRPLFWDGDPECPALADDPRKPLELKRLNVVENPTEANLVQLLDCWSADWKHRGRTRAVGPGAYERYATLGLFGHGGIVGVSNATGQRAACSAVNRFLKSRFPNGTWSSIAVLFNPRMGLHRDIQNMPGHLNHALALGDYTGGRVWIEDDEGDSTARLAAKTGERELRGKWLDMHDKPVSFDARRYHMVEPHEGSMWALAAYVPQAYARATEQHREVLAEVGFPLPQCPTKSDFA
ncbi:unnamed protein product [Symbiodinium sp. CCMP2592]|nr:unnamed protein product [Symbiodinium sp. CCMP2592]